jgi:hypothetical protein
VIAESDQPITGGTVASPLRAFEYMMPTTSSPAALKSYSFASQTPSFSVGAVPVSDDSTQAISYFDAAGRGVQVRTRLSSGTAASSPNGNVIKSLAAQYSVRSNVLLDGLGRVTASLEPYFSSSGAYVDPRSNTEFSTSGLHASVVAYDSESRPTCTIYEPVAGSILPAPASACLSNYAESPSVNYRRATQTAYGVDSSLDGRSYMTADTVASWAASGSTPSRVYIDSMGRVRHTKTPSGTYEQTNYDPLGRALSVIRSSSTPTVTSSWTYDKRGRVSSEFADAAGYKMYSYLPTGETVQVLQNPAPGTSIADAKSVWSVQTIGSLGRVMERDDARSLK